MEFKIFINLAQFPASTVVSYSMVKIAGLDDAFSEIFELEASPVEGQSLKMKAERLKVKSCSLIYFCINLLFASYESPREIPHTRSQPHDDSTK